jgi:hypothetical protein
MTQNIGLKVKFKNHVVNLLNLESTVPKEH